MANHPPTSPSQRPASFMLNSIFSSPVHARKMITSAEKQRLRGMIAETITLLCKSGLSDKFEEEFFIEGLIGITLDHKELMMVSIREKVSTGNEDEDKEGSSEDSTILIEDKSFSGRKRKKLRLDGPREKTSKSNHNHEGTSSPMRGLPVSPLLNKPSDHCTTSFSNTIDKENRPASSPKNPQPSSPLLNPPVYPYKLPSSLGNGNSLDLYKNTPSPSALDSGPVSHLERLKNLYLMSAGFPSAINFPRPQTTTVVSQNNRHNAVNLAVDKNSTLDLSRKDQDLISSKYQPEIKVKEEESAKPPSPLLVQPLPALQPYASLYSSPLQQQQPVFNEPIMVPHLQSPGQTPKRDAKLTEVLDRIKTNLESNPEANRNRSVSDHIAQHIVRSEGTFVTSRIIGRKTGRKAAAVKEVFLNLTTPITDSSHVGQAKEISRGTLVYYKCPPKLIKPEALEKYGLDMYTYTFLYNSEMKTPPSQHMLAIVEERSPYNPHAADDFSSYSYQSPMTTFGRMKKSNEYGLNSTNEVTEDDVKISGDFNDMKQPDNDEHTTLDEVPNDNSNVKVGIDFNSTLTMETDTANKNYPETSANIIVDPSDRQEVKSSIGSDIQGELEEDTIDSICSGDISNKENNRELCNTAKDTSQSDSYLQADSNSQSDVPLQTDNTDFINAGSQGFITGEHLLPDSESGMASPLKGLEKLVSLQSSDLA